jgi:hypothetical protein
LQREVDREGVLLERGELRAREYAEGYDARDEGLEERRAQEGAITMLLLVFLSIESCSVALYLSRWYVAGFLNDENDILAIVPSSSTPYQ